MATTRKPWTPARHRAFIIATLRNGSRRYPPKYETLKEAATTKKKNKKTNRIAQHYKCNACKKDFPTSEVNVDHVIPVVGEEGFVDWNTFIERLFCSKDNLQVLCKTCHDKKTKGERNRRKNII